MGEAHGNAGPRQALAGFRVGRIAEDITELIGNTPLVKLNRIGEGLNATILAKMESHNPCASVRTASAWPW